MNRSWTRRRFRRKESITTRWTFHLALTAGALLILALTRTVWVPGIGHALVCRQEVRPADAILIENFDQDYLLFERAAELRRAAGFPRVIVPTPASSDVREPNLVSAGIVDVMAGVARLPSLDVIPFRAVEPITLNAAYEIRDFLQKEDLHSVLVVARGFRSRRASLVYGAVFGEARIASYCVPVFGQPTIETWTDTWHGVLQVAEQHVKLQYYRFYVLPRRLMKTWPADARGDRG
jgi:hypothetical protein